MPGENGEQKHELRTENINVNIPKDLEELKKSIQQNIQIPDALRVDPLPKKEKVSEPKIIASGEFIGEKEGAAPGEKYFSKTGAELNYLMLYKKLSYKDYFELFNRFVDVRQGSLGDCYLVSSIKSLARSRYFDTLMMTSIQKNKDGSFNLYLPLGNPSGRKIHISREELKLAKINGSDGYKILEVGFAKEVLLRKNGLLLYIGDMPDIKLTRDSMNGIIGGNSFNALAILLGPFNVKRQLINNNLKCKNFIINELKKFNPRNGDLIVVSSCRRPEGVPSSQKTYKINGRSMYYNHAYSLYAVEKRGDHIESVTLEDPTNNKKKIKLTLLGFMLSFYQMTTCRPIEGFLPLI